MQNEFKNNRGFTLIELLMVIGVIAILAGMTFVALNPLARFQDSRNVQRWADVNAVMSAVKLHQIDNEGIYLDSITSLSSDLYYQIGMGDQCNDTCSNPTVILQTECLDLEELIDGGYLAKWAIDPSDTGASEDETRYYFVKTTNGPLIVGSCSEEKGSNSAIPDISITQ